MIINEIINAYEYVLLFSDNIMYSDYNRFSMMCAKKIYTLYSDGYVIITFCYLISGHILVRVNDSALCLGADNEVIDFEQGLLS